MSGASGPTLQGENDRLNQGPAVETSVGMTFLGGTGGPGAIVGSSHTEPEEVRLEP